jgi:hypothetical protein
LRDTDGATDPHRGNPLPAAARQKAPHLAVGERAADPQDSAACSTVSINGSSATAASIVSRRSIPQRGTRLRHGRQDHPAAGQLGPADQKTPAATSEHKRSQDGLNVVTDITSLRVISVGVSRRRLRRDAEG